MEILRKEEDAKGMFYVETDGNVKAKMMYHMRSPHDMVIEHTEVDDELRGQNIGFKLVKASVEYARQQRIRLTVWCPFAKSIFDKRPDWQDVLNQ